MLSFYFAKRRESDLKKLFLLLALLLLGSWNEGIGQHQA